jgi:hypothetical protein
VKPRPPFSARLGRVGRLIGFGTIATIGMTASVGAGPRATASEPTTPPISRFTTAPAVTTVPTASTVPSRSVTGASIALLNQRFEFGPVTPPTNPPTSPPTNPPTVTAPLPVDSFVIDVDVESGTSLQGARLATTVFQRVRTRDAFEQASTGDELGSPIGFLTTPAPPLRADQSSFLGTIRLPLGDPSDNCARCINFGDGVYPVSVELRGPNEDTLDRFITFISTHSSLPGSDTTGGTRKLQVGLLVSLQSTPVIRSAQDITPVQPVRSFIAMVEALASRREVPLSLSIVPQSLDQLEPTDSDGQVKTAGLLDLLRLSIANREVLQSPYVRVTNTLLDDSSLEPFRRQLFDLGRQSLQRHLQTAPVDGLMVTPTVVNSDKVLDQLKISKLIIAPSAVSDESGGALPLATPIIVDPGARSGNATAARPAIVLDETVAQRFTRKLSSRPIVSDDQLRVQHVMAELALIEQLTRGSTQRGIPVAVPVNTSQATLVGVLNALADSATLEPARVSTLFDNPVEQDKTGALVLHTPTSDTPANTPTLDQAAKDRIAKNQAAENIAKYIAIDERNAGYASLFGTGPIDLTTQTEIDSLRREAATLLAQDFTEKQRNAAATEVQKQFDGLLERVANQSSRRITLTAQSQDIPLALVNDTGRPITVNVIVETDNAELPQGTRDPLAPARQVLKLVVPIKGRVVEQPIRLATKGPGRYSMLVRLQTPSGYEFSRTRYTLQATSIGALGKLLTIGSLTFLAFWWALTISRKRKAAKATSALHHPATTSVTPQTPPQTPPQTSQQTQRPHRTQRR